MEKNLSENLVKGWKKEKIYVKFGGLARQRDTMRVQKMDCNMSVWLYWSCCTKKVLRESKKKKSWSGWRNEQKNGKILRVFCGWCWVRVWELLMRAPDSGAEYALIRWWETHWRWSHRGERSGSVRRVANRHPTSVENGKNVAQNLNHKHGTRKKNWKIWR